MARTLAGKESTSAAKTVGDFIHEKLRLRGVAAWVENGDEHAYNYLHYLLREIPEFCWQISSWRYRYVGKGVFF